MLLNLYKARYSLRSWSGQSVHRESNNNNSFQGCKENSSLSQMYYRIGLYYSVSNDYKLVGYSDNDWSRDMDDCKSTTSFVFYMGGTTFTWVLKKKSIVTLSTCEAEYVAVTSCVCYEIWFQNLLKEMSVLQKESTKIFVDNKAAIALAKNPVFHDRSKHIDTRYHYIRECIARKDVQLEYVKSHDQVVNIFTKPLKQEYFIKLKKFDWSNKIKFKRGC